MITWVGRIWRAALCRMFGHVPPTPVRGFSTRLSICQRCGKVGALFG